MIEKVIDETPYIRTFVLDRTFRANPGQYVMVWVRGVDEVPMSLSYENAITVQKVGDATSAMFGLGKGDRLGVRGPYGNGFTLTGRSILVIAGGVGAAPLASLAELAHSSGISVTTLLGARTKTELLFAERFRQAGELRIATDDGSFGHAGFVTQLLERTDLSDFDGIYTCGPEQMMARILNIVKDSMLDRIQLSLHRYIKCGFGICGACCIDPEGLRVCADGPVFTGIRLANSEFGKYRRNECGMKVHVQ